MTRLVHWARTLWPFGNPMPFPERRRRMRYLTLKNAVFAPVALVAAFVLLSIWSSYRPAHSGASRLDPRVASSESLSVNREPLAIVQEGPAHESPGADSMLVDPATASASLPPASTSATQPKNIVPHGLQVEKGERIAISGDREGVHVRVEKVSPTVDP